MKAQWTVATALFAGVTGAAAGTVAALPTETGCPTSSDVLEVAALTAQGYRVPARVDLAGNGDGLVCAHEQPEGMAFGLSHHFEHNSALTLYLFGDNTNPAQR